MKWERSIEKQIKQEQEEFYKRLKLNSKGE